MARFCISHDFYDHPKVIDLVDSVAGPGAIALWTLAGAWSAKHLTDGRIPDSIVARLGAATDAPAALIAAGLWESTDEGYQFARDGFWVIDEPRSKLPRREVFERDGWVCRYCGASITLATGHCDHVMPKSRGGADDMSNLVAACGPCNLSKGARTPEEWRQ